MDENKTMEQTTETVMVEEVKEGKVKAFCKKTFTKANLKKAGLVLAGIGAGVGAMILKEKRSDNLLEGYVVDETDGNIEVDVNTEI